MQAIFAGLFSGNLAVPAKLRAASLLVNSIVVTSLDDSNAQALDLLRLALERCALPSVEHEPLLRVLVLHVESSLGSPHSFRDFLERFDVRWLALFLPSLMRGGDARGGQQCIERDLARLDLVHSALCVAPQLEFELTHLTMDVALQHTDLTYSLLRTLANVRNQRRLQAASIAFLAKLCSAYTQLNESLAHSDEDQQTQSEWHDNMQKATAKLLERLCIDLPMEVTELVNVVLNQILDTNEELSPMPFYILENFEPALLMKTVQLAIGQVSTNEIFRISNVLAKLCRFPLTGRIACLLSTVITTTTAATDGAVLDKLIADVFPLVCKHLLVPPSQHSALVMLERLTASLTSPAAVVPLLLQVADQLTDACPPQQQLHTVAPLPAASASSALQLAACHVPIHQLVDVMHGRGADLVERDVIERVVQLAAVALRDAGSRPERVGVRTQLVAALLERYFGDALPLGETYERLPRDWSDNKWSGKAAEDDDMDERGHSGLVGLDNMGNSCFMNAVTQALFCIEQLHNVVYQPVKNDNPTKLSADELVQQRAVSNALQTIFARLLLSKAHSIVPKELYNTLPVYLRNGGQQDADECARFFLTALSSSLFIGQMDRQTTCLTCQSVSTRTESFDILAVPLESSESPTTTNHSVDYSVKNDDAVMGSLEDDLPANTATVAPLDNPKQLQLEDLLGNITKSESIAEYVCDSCPTRQPAERHLTITSMPEVLILSLSRFSYHAKENRRIKLMDQVVYPEILPVTSDSNDSSVYRLRAVIVHSGESAHGGHYFAYGSFDDNRWHRFDDSTVSNCTLAHALQVHQVSKRMTPYILVYIRAPADTDTAVQRPTLNQLVPSRVAEAVEAENRKRKQARKRQLQAATGFLGANSHSRYNNDRDDDYYGGPSFGGGGGGFHGSSREIF